MVTQTHSPNTPIPRGQGSHVYEPVWNPEDLSTEQDANPDIGPIMQGKRAGTTVPGGRTSPRSPETRSYYGVSGNGYLWYMEYYIDGSTNWRDEDGGTNWSFQKDDKRTSSSACTEGRSEITWGWLAPSLWQNRDSIGLGCVQM